MTFLRLEHIRCSKSDVVFFVVRCDACAHVSYYRFDKTSWIDDDFTMPNHIPEVRCRCGACGVPR